MKRPVGFLVPTVKAEDGFLQDPSLGGRATCFAELMCKAYVFDFDLRNNRVDVGVDFSPISSTGRAGLVVGIRPFWEFESSNTSQSMNQ